MKTRAAVLQAIGRPQPYAESRPLVVEELALDPPGPGEVLVEIKAAGLCHSDLSVINGDRPRPTPMALGHCGRCPPFRQGRPALCEPGAAANVAGNLLSGTRKLRRADGPVHHHMGVSAFSELAVVSRNSCVRIDPELPLEEAALFGCAVLTGVGAVVNTARVVPGQSVAVVGLGGVGLNALLGAGLAGARRIVALDLVDDKLALARQLGATDTFNAGDADCAQAVRERPLAGSTSPSRWPARSRRWSSPGRSPGAAAPR